MAVRRSKWCVITALVVIALMALPIVGSVIRHPVEEPRAGLVVTRGQDMAFDLYTHCGISELKP